MQMVAKRAKISCGVMLYIANEADEGNVPSMILYTNLKLAVVVPSRGENGRNGSRRRIFIYSVSFRPSHSPQLGQCYTV